MIDLVKQINHQTAMPDTKSLKAMYSLSNFL